MASFKSKQVDMSQQELSESVYLELCRQIGTTQQIANRREVGDIGELLKNIDTKTEEFMMISGSFREGFRLKGSDVDCMFWPKDHPVLWDFSQAKFYNTQRLNLILCNSSESPPGSTLLLLLLGKAHRIVLSSCIRINGILYISSAQYRRNASTVMYPHDSQVHGPCSRGTTGTLEYDLAHCFASDFWPPPADSWKGRRRSWPPPSIVKDIVSSGCHFAAIGHKHGKHEDNEWRISFSQAERKLVLAMNHTQFLIYGMLKLFVKELNTGLSDEEKILSSYHMKTVIFWAIQEKTIFNWCPQNLLVGFWDCFKFLVKWVYEGVCPNFFIPENNMFLNKVHGAAQTNLFTRLYGLYEKGLASLLRRLFVGTNMDGLCTSTSSVDMDERALISEALVDRDLFYEIYANAGLCISPNLSSCIKCMHTLEKWITKSWTQCQIIVLQKYASNLFQASVYMLHAIHTELQRGNKKMYVADKMSCSVLKLAAKFGFVSDLLYIAMYYYKTFRIREALSVIELTKVKLTQPCLIYIGQVDPERYSEAVGGQSLSKKMRQAVAQSTNLKNGICYITELMPEQKSGFLNKMSELIIPPVIMLHMLDFLCCRHVDPIRSQATLDNLQVLVHHDQGVLIPVDLRDISWQILGICQEITGNYQAALYSYHQSLRQEPLNRIHIATRDRIDGLNLKTH